MTKNAYSIRVLEYAFALNCPESAVIYGAHNEGIRKLPYAYVLIQGQGHNIMVDVGYNHAEYGGFLADKFGVINWQPPHAVLAECDLTPEDIDVVILTHAHFDHMGNIQAFPNAKFYIQEREISNWISAMAQPAHMQWAMLGTDPSDVLRVADLARQGRLVCLKGEVEDLLPGIDVHTAFNTHTDGCMWVKVRNDLARDSQNVWVLAGDLVYSYKNLLDDPKIVGGEVEGDLRLRPVGLAMGSMVNLIHSSDEMLKHVGYQIKRLIPVHEQLLPQVFPSRITEAGLQLIEVSLADDDFSRVC
ncbi:N-acyl homoserine lactonase family protein [Pseudomonas iranensis]|uniref:N-acyl homoserine lactonase family protein n=1 Tax=Pseudomonas iranensis TaxID=2745503 RepID=UPI0016496D4B|nr:N-acyl homoserine lactonase family protein [Pseudomonas iranensis]QXI20172.1 N-acyl homoserine lactonase family protein [Pseudomonas iranensis]